jgi:hypothetical protein
MSDEIQSSGLAEKIGTAIGAVVVVMTFAMLAWVVLRGMF